MSSPNKSSPHILLVEDNIFLSRLIGHSLSIGGMSILSSQISKPEEIEPVLGALAEENTCPDVVILDANLRSGDNSGDDARRVTRVLRDMKMAPLVLGFSANLFPPDIVVARSCIKDSDTIRALPRIIAEMLSESAA